VIWGAVIVAAGRGTRFGRPKQLALLGDRPMLAYSIETFAAMPEICELVIVTEPEYIEDVQALALGRVGALPCRVVAGGAERQDSVRCGLDALADGCAGVLVHDGARPLVRPSEIRAGMRVVRAGIASLLVTPVVDTIKVLGEDNRVARTLDRATLVAAQTPQFALTRDMRRAHADAERSGTVVTDDTALLERAGCDVIAVVGSPDNFKITHAQDVVRAEAILAQRDPKIVDEEEVLLVESFVPERAIDDVAEEIGRRDGRVDEINRDLPSATVIRAYIAASRLRGFGAQLHVLGGADAMFTAHFAHFAPRNPADRSTS